MSTHLLSLSLESLDELQGTVFRPVTHYANCPIMILCLATLYTLVIPHLKFHIC